jgi:hypothetical protein
MTALSFTLWRTEAIADKGKPDGKDDGQAAAILKRRIPSAAQSKVPKVPAVGSSGAKCG